MKYTTYILGVVVLALIFAPASTLAHGEAEPSDGAAQVPSGMMMHMQNGDIDADQYEEMQELMEKMFDEELTESDAQQMREFMQEHPGEYNTMFDRMHHTYDDHHYSAVGPMGMMGPGGWMDGSWGTGMYGWVFGIGWLAWLLVGVLLVVLLIKKIMKTNNE